MEGILKILLNALPEALGALIATGIIALLSYLFVKKLKRGSPDANIPEALPLEPPKPEIYSNLPPRTEFIGREKEKVLVTEALNYRWPLVCIDGIGGIGKTSLALEVVHESLRISKNKVTSEKESTTKSTVPEFSGFIWTTAKDRELQLNDILDAIARTLDWPGIAQQSVDEKTESVRRLLQTKRYLLIVDNFETITDESIRNFLLNIPEPSKALITSREQKIPQAWAVSIKGLEPSEALMLIRNEGRRLGLNSIQEAEDQILMRLYKATGGAPLAIKWAVGQIKQKGQSLDTVLSALHEAKGDIFEEIFARSWSLLSYDAKKVLMVMPIFASSASREAIEAASDVHHFALDEALGQLVQMWMVEVMDELEQAKRRYSVHPLTRAFAESQLEESKELQNIAKERLLTYFLNFTKKYGKRNWRGYDKLELERENILSIITWCYDSQKWQQVIEFHDSLIDFLWIRGYWDNRLKFAFQTLEASKQIGSQWSLAFCMVYDLGWTYLRRQEYEIAKDWINEGLQIFEMLNDNYGIAIAMRNLGNIATREKSISEAQELYKKSLIKAEAANLDHLAYEIRCSIGNLLSQELTKYQEAQLQLEMSKKYFQKVGDDIRFSTALFGIAVNESIHGNSNDAKKLFHECLNLTKKIGRRDQLANILWFLALEEEKSNNILSALKYVKESNESFERLGLKYEYEQTKELIEKLEKKIH